MVPTGRFNRVLGFVGVGYLVMFARYHWLAAGREHPGNAVISLLCLLLSFVPAFGVVLAGVNPKRPFVGWRFLAIVFCVVLAAPLYLVWTYER